MNGKNLVLRRFVRNRPHLSASIGLGIVAGLLAPASLSPLTHALIGWNVAVWSFLAGIFPLIARSDHHKVRDMAARQDESAGAVLATLTAGAVLSLSAIIAEMRQIPFQSPDERALQYLFTAATVGGSWLLVGVLFSFHYAHLFYNSAKPPLHFPEGLATPDYWDFMYFSFTIAVAVATSDVSVMSSSMRRLVLVQSVLSFFFNLTILGLAINLAATLLNR